MITRVKKGDKFVCIMDVVMDGDPDTIAFTKGNVYISERSDCLTSDSNNKGHIVITDTNDAWTNKHFIPYTYAAIWERYKAAKDMEEAEPYVNLLRELDSSMGRSTAGGGNYKPNFDRCKAICPPNCDPDTCQELHREQIHAEAVDSAIGWQDRVHQQGTLHIRLNGADLATIDSNTSQITGLPATLDFEQFEFINRLVTAIKPK